MTTMYRALTLTTLLLAITFTPLLAQDQFGRTVAIVGDDVFVLKPTAGRGPATVSVFRRGDDGAWHVVDRLLPSGGVETGEGFSPSIARAGGMVLVGSSDPAGAWGAHTFRRNTEGKWMAAGRLSLHMGAEPPSGDAPLDLAGLMQILQPPQRIVAFDGNLAVVAVTGGARPATTGDVRVFARDGDSGTWAERAQLVASEVRSTDQFGAALAIESNRVLVGAPRHDGSGAAFVFARDDATGAWRQEAKIVRADSAPESRFGTAVALHRGVALIGAPGTGGTRGIVIAFARDDRTGTWSERQRLAPAEGTAGDLFGFAMAASENELWVGAPGANERRGTIHRFTRQGVSDAWSAATPVDTRGSEPGYSLGLSVALGTDLAAAGAPGADGGRGRAAVFTRSPDGTWSEARWFEAGGDLEMVAGEEVSCNEGEAAGFDCGNVDLLAFLPINALGGGPGERVSDVWGWTDPGTGREYALVGRTGGTAFVDITNPTTPVYLGILPANRSGARDIKVYDDHLFFTGDGAGDHGLMVFNLAHLREVRMPPVTFQPDARYDGIASAHNLIIDTESGFAYPVGASGGGQTCGGGLHMVDIRDPLNPTFAGCYTDTEGLIWPGRTHDGQCVVYRGPDENYQGRQICFASNETALRIVDVTEKENPVPIAAATYPGIAYVHQGWLTEDHRYFYLDDELDELVGQTDRTRTLVWDVAELDDPVLVGEYFGPNGATDHNLYVKGDRMYQANYQAGFRVVDISDPERPVEVGFFDTTPYEGDPPGFNGAWTAYPFFESGTVIVTSMYEGLFLLRPRARELVP